MLLYYNYSNVVANVTHNILLLCPRHEKQKPLFPRNLCHPRLPMLWTNVWKSWREEEVSHPSLTESKQYNFHSETEKDSEISTICPCIFLINLYFLGFCFITTGDNEMVKKKFWISACSPQQEVFTRPFLPLAEDSFISWSLHLT